MGVTVMNVAVVDGSVTRLQNEKDVENTTTADTTHKGEKNALALARVIDLAQLYTLISVWR